MPRSQVSSTHFPVMVDGTPVLGAAGDVIGILGISWDLSERKRTQEALRTAKEEAERANRSKPEFLSAMSHELRTPLVFRYFSSGRVDPPDRTATFR